MRHGSLFSGIGGFDLAAMWMGWHNVFHCEKDAFCQKILQHHWPLSKSYEDIRKFSAVEYRGLVDIISAGFPCQPFSVAGKRQGKNDDRFLWPQTIRVIGEAKPKWIVLENVAGLFSILEPESLSQVEIKEIELFCADQTKQSSTILTVQRRIIGSIISEIRAVGYLLPTLSDGTPVVLCIPACAVGAPHRRDRIWLVAYADGDTAGPLQYGGGAGHAGSSPWQAGLEERLWETVLGAGRFDIPAYQKTIAHLFTHPDTYGEYVQRGPQAGDAPGGRPQRDQQPAGFYQRPDWDHWPRQRPFHSGDDGLPGELDGISFSKWRTESLRAYGNAIVPSVAFEIFRAIAALG